MTSKMLPAEEEWTTLSAEELREHLGALKQSSNELLRKLVGMDQEIRRMQAERHMMHSTNERLTKRVVELELERKTFVQQAVNANLLFALYRELAQRGSVASVEVAEHRLAQASIITMLPPEKISSVVQETLDTLGVEKRPSTRGKRKARPKKKRTGSTAVSA
jgi:regulator of replication initiation timing